MTSAKTGIGTLLVRDVTATSKAYPIAEITKIGGPTCSSGEIDVTNFDSVGDYAEFIPGNLDGGELSIEANFIPGDTNGQIAMVADFNSRTTRTWWIHLPGAMGASFTFSAYVKSYAVIDSAKDAVKFSATLRVSGGTDLITVPATGLTTPFFALRDSAAGAVTPSPAAATATYGYTAAIPTGTTGVAIQPTAATGSPTIYVNGNVVVSGAWSADVPIALGKSAMIYVEVRAADKASKVYRISVSRPAA